jgi:hypothetical protein
LGIDFEIRRDKLQINMTPKDFEENKDFLQKVLPEAVIEDEKE